MGWPSLESSKPSPLWLRRLPRPPEGEVGGLWGGRLLCPEVCLFSPARSGTVSRLPPAGSVLGIQGTRRSLLGKAEGVESPKAGCSQLRMLFGHWIPSTWPGEGPLPGPEVGPLRQGASQAGLQARTGGQSTEGWAGHA